MPYPAIDQKTQPITRKLGQAAMMNAVGDSADVWNVRFRWTEIKPKLQRDLLAG